LALNAPAALTAEVAAKAVVIAKITFMMIDDVCY